MQRITIRLAAAIITFLVGISVATVPNSFRPDAVVSSSRVEQEVLAVERQYINAHVGRGASTLNRILADDFTLELPSGRVTTKAARLALIDDPDFSFLSITTDDVEVRIVGENRAVVTGRAVLEGRYGDLEFTSPTYRFTRVYEKRQLGWQIVTVRISGVPAY